MLHYGSDYLEVCLKSLETACDKIIILYSMNPTHQDSSIEINRETRADLKKIADQFDKVQWVDCFGIHGEGHHRGQIWNYVKGYDVLVNADYDEVWEPEDLQRAIQEVYNSPFRNHGIDGFITFFRGFNYITNPDSYRPVRLWNLREKNTAQEPAIKAKIYHFGYAIRRRTMAYKWSIHGHISELRPEWLDLWNNWQLKDMKGDFHPTSYGVWTEISQFDREQLPDFVKAHKFYNFEII